MRDEEEKGHISCNNIKTFYCGPSRLKQEGPLLIVVSIMNVKKEVHGCITSSSSEQV